MTTTSPLSDRNGALTGAVLALIPWAAFVLAVVLADVGDGAAHTFDGVATVAPIALLFVAVPCLLPLAMARAVLTTVAALVVMTAVAVMAAVLLVTTDDGQAGLAVFWVVAVAMPLAAVVWVGQTVVARQTTTGTTFGAAPGALARPSDRVAALAIDVALAGAVLYVPLTLLSDTGYEIAALLLGVAGAALAMAALVIIRGRTLGQSVLKLAVIDATTGGRVPPARAVLRSLVVVLEATAIPTILLAAAAAAEMAAVAVGGRSLTDRLTRTSVVTTR